MDSPSPTSAKLAAATVGAASVPEGTYYYCVTALIPNPNIYGGFGETKFSCQSFPVVVASPNNAVNLSWPAVQGASTYNIYRTTTPGNYDPEGQSCLLGNTASTSFQDTLASPPGGGYPLDNALLISLSPFAASWLDCTNGLTLRNLPTSDPVSAGALWNSSGTLKVSAG